MLKPTESEPTRIQKDHVKQEVEADWAEEQEVGD